MRYQEKRVRGFTLIELIIVITIIGILSTVSLASFVSYSKNQSIQQAALDVKATLQQAKSYSQSQVKPTSCGTNVLKGYRVDICGLTGSLCSTTNTYQLSVLCGTTTTLQSTEKLPRNVSFQESGTTSVSYFFPLLGESVDKEGSVAIAGFSQTVKVSVTKQGVISLE